MAQHTNTIMHIDIKRKSDTQSNNPDTHVALLCRELTQLG